MKKILATILILSMASALCACGEISTEQKTPDGIFTPLYKVIDSAVNPSWNTPKEELIALYGEENCTSDEDGITADITVAGCEFFVHYKYDESNELERCRLVPDVDITFDQETGVEKVVESIDSNTEYLDKVIVNHNDPFFPKEVIMYCLKNENSTVVVKYPYGDFYIDIYPYIADIGQ